jgi:hypothetical protein
LSDLTPELAAVAEELESARRHAHRLAEAAGDDAWGAAPEPGVWSAAECLQHLNLTSGVYLPSVREVIEEGRRAGRLRRRAHRRDFIGWLFCRLLEPPARMRVKTPPRFVPRDPQPKDRVLGDFDRLQGELASLLAPADALDLKGIKVRSPFAQWARYNIYSIFKVIAAHQRRHLWQADRALARIARAGTR